MMNCQGKKNKVLCLFFLIPIFVLGQRTITGTITEKADDSPLMGTSIVVEGTSMGVLSDIDGKYTIALPEDARDLTFSHTGFTKQKIKIGSSNTIDVQMYPPLMNISGTVRDASNDQPLQGVSIQEEEGIYGATTDFDGNYFIALPERTKQLTFSLSGYTSQEISIDSQKTINVQLYQGQLSSKLLRFQALLLLVFCLASVGWAYTKIVQPSEPHLLRWFWGLSVLLLLYSLLIIVWN
ncbi:MAG: carboxypeptidase-like regulatory domain-containing protein [Bacteroidota bacterium]